MKNIFVIIILIFIFILYLLIVNNTGKRYKKYLPTINFLYPSNNEEVKKVIKESKERNNSDVDFFFMTDASVIPAFKPFVKNISINKLFSISTSQNNKITFLKNFINRPRPNQLSNQIKMLKSNTAATPSFPAGHAAQAYILANYLQKIYPNKKKLFEKIADRCNNCRIKAGLHYPSDGMYSKLLFYNNKIN